VTAKKPAKKSIVALADIPMMQPAAGRSKEDRARERRYAAEDALRTLTAAEKHRANPSLMRDVKKIAAEHVRDMAKIAKK
jgi:hypothetical protein